MKYRDDIQLEIDLMDESLCYNRSQLASATLP